MDTGCFLFDPLLNLHNFVFIGTVTPSLLPAPAEPDTQEAEVVHNHMSIRSLLEVKPETNVVCTIFVVVMNHAYAFE